IDIYIDENCGLLYKALIDQGVADALAARDVDRSMNGDDSHNSRPGVWRGDKLLLLDVGHDVAYAMTWTNLKKMMTDKYCPRGEIKKLEVEMWNLKVKGTDVVGYNQRFQELALMCARMFPEESDKIEKYISTLAERQAENKRKLDNINMLNYKLFPRKQGGGDSLYRRVSKREGESVLITDQRNLTCYECGNQGHYKSDFPKLKNRNHENQAESTEACGMVCLRRRRNRPRP
ncbi:reverse transcriptase domain-containing protein, partial [Tanacetum coccineum]